MQIFTDYQSAKEYAESSYWVDPIHFPSDDVEFYFDERYKAVDWSESGKVHYARR